MQVFSTKQTNVAGEICMQFWSNLAVLFQRNRLI